MTQKISQAVVGKWPAILTQFGIDESYLTGKHGPCPICQDGKDRFRFDDKEGKGTFYCTHCGAGGGFKFLELMYGWEFPIAAKKVEEVIGKCSDYVPSHTGKPDPKIRLTATQRAARNITDADEVHDYLVHRGISPTIISEARRLKIVKQNYFRNGKNIGEFNCMAGLVTRGQKALTYHLTYLSCGKKVKMDPPRKILTPTKSIAGAAIELFEHNGVLGVAEGIETALSAYQIFEIPTWAVLNTSNMQSFEIPKDITELHIYGDNDKNFAGQKAAYQLANRCILKNIHVEVHIPEYPGNDWNDELCR